MSAPRIFDYVAPCECPEQRLAIWVLALAVKDARYNNVTARIWLWSEEAAWWAKVAGFEQWPNEELMRRSGL